MLRSITHSRPRRTSRRLGQGMTEYILLVGLIAILLVAVVGAFRDQLDVTIQGSDGNGGMSGSVDDVGGSIRDSGGSRGGGDGLTPDGGTARHPTRGVNEPTYTGPNGRVFGDGTPVR
jgi:hypothetical protein